MSGTTLVLIAVGVFGLALLAWPWCATVWGERVARRDDHQ